jgi:peptide/nickel transport system substrate-binding protein
MADIEKLLQDSGIITQPFWRKFYNHSAPARVIPCDFAR